MSDEVPKSSNIDKRDKDEKKLPAKKKEKREHSTTELKEKSEKLPAQKSKSNYAEQPSTSARSRSKDRSAEHSKRNSSGHKRESKAKGGSKSKLEDSNTGVRRKKSEKLRRFLSITSSDHADIGDVGSFHSAISSSYFSPSASSIFQSAKSVDTIENLKRHPPPPLRLSLTQRLAQHFRPSEKKIEEEIVGISNLQPPEETATSSRQPPVLKPAPTLIDVSAQTSLTLTGQQLPIHVHTTAESEVRQPPPISQPEIRETPKSPFTHHLPVVKEVRSGSTTDEGPREREKHRPHPKRRFFETTAPGISIELQQDVESAPKKNEEAEDISKKAKKQHKLQSDISSTTIDTQSEGSVKAHESNYDNDKGGYTSEVDDVIDDSLQRRISHRKEKEARGHVTGSHESGTKDAVQGKSSIRRMHSMSSRLETNLKVGTAFIYMIIPPDGGFGWIIMLMSFLSQVIVDGIVFSIGIILPYMASDLDAHTSEIALVVSIQIGCYFFSGPITTAFINKFGFRPVALTGVVLSLCTLSIASLSPNLTMLIIFYSLIGGPALSMIWVSSQLIIGYYFEKYRPIASGISCAGAGAGMLIFSIVNLQLVPELDWRNTCRVHILILICVVFIALTFIEVKPTKIAEMPEESETDSSDDIESMTNSNRYTRLDIYKSLYNMRRGLGENLVEMPSEDNDKKKGLLERCLIACCPAFGTYRRGQEDSPAFGDTDAKRFVIQTGPIERQDIYYTGPAAYEDRDNSEIVSIAGADVKMLSDQRKQIRTINYTLSMIQLSKHTKDHRKKKQTEKSVCLEFLSFISPTYWLPVKVKRALRILFDFRTLRILEFKILCLSAVLFSTGFNIPFVYSKERAKIEKFYEDMIPPAIGLSNLAFRILAGFIAYWYKEYTTYICGWGIFFGGIVTFISGFYGDDLIWFQFTFAFCYGVAPAFYSTLRSIIYVRYLGLENLTSGFGITSMGMGLGVFLGTTTGGLLYEVTEELNASFIFSGICIMTSGGLKLILPTLTEWRKKKKLATNKMDSKI